MKNIIYKVITASLIFIIFLLSFGQSSEAATRRFSRSVNNETAEPDTGRSRVSSAFSKEIRRLEGMNPVSNLPIPILFGVTVANLEDTWGDARSEERTHEGIDILASRNEFVVSPIEAIVTTINTAGNGGNYVFTTNPGGERYYFAHLDHFAENLKEGQILKAGDLIGYVGNTGNAAGGPTHLHFGMYDDSHDAFNPFPRLKREFTTQERLDAFTKILSESNDANALAEKVVNQYKNVFVEAQAQGAKLPAAVLNILTEKRTAILGISRVLQVDMKGEDVKALQAVLGVTADGSFGPKTKAALALFQIKAGLPGDGVFGATTRLALSNSSIATTTLPAGCTATSVYSVTTGIRCMPVVATPLGCTATTLFSPITGIRC